MQRRGTFQLRAKALAVVTATSPFAPSGSGQQALQPKVPIDSVRIEVTWVGSQAELDAKRREYGSSGPTSSVVRETLEAFSVLGRRDGDLVCLIFARKPARFDDRLNTSLGHELLHCFGFNHGS